MRSLTHEQWPVEHIKAARYPVLPERMGCRTCIALIVFSISSTLPVDSFWTFEKVSIMAATTKLKRQKNISRGKNTTETYPVKVSTDERSTSGSKNKGYSPVK